MQSCLSTVFFIAACATSLSLSASEPPVTRLPLMKSSFEAFKEKFPSAKGEIVELTEGTSIPLDLMISGEVFAVDSYSSAFLLTLKKTVLVAGR